MVASCCSMSLLVKQGILFTDIQTATVWTCCCFIAATRAWRMPFEETFRGLKQSFSLISFPLTSLLKCFPSYLISIALFMDTLWSCSLMGCVLHHGIHKFRPYFGLRLVLSVTSAIPNLRGPHCTLSSVTSTTFSVLLRQAGTRKVCVDCRDFESVMEWGLTMATSICWCSAWCSPRRLVRMH